VLRHFDDEVPQGEDRRHADGADPQFKWSVALVAVMCVIVYLQSTAVLSWMVP
jgi:hypothetical protein